MTERSVSIPGGDGQHSSVAPREASFGRLLTITQRPMANVSGGAGNVNNDMDPTWTIGPGTPIPDHDWVKSSMDYLRVPVSDIPDTEEKPSTDVHRIHVSATVTELHYSSVSLEQWLARHEIGIGDFASGEEYDHMHWFGVLPQNSLGGEAVRHMVKTYGLTTEDTTISQDFQNQNVPTQGFISHTPEPSVGFLMDSAVSVTPRKNNEYRESVALIDMPSYRDRIEQVSSRALTTFQRATDQANFIMQAAYVAGWSTRFSVEKFPNQFSIENLQDQSLVTLPRDMQRIREIPGREERDKQLGEIHAKLMAELAHGRETPMGAMTHLQLFGSKTSLVNVPVGLVPERVRSTAEINKDKLNKTKFERHPESDEWSLFNADLGEGEFANLTPCDPEDFVDRQPTVRDVLMAIGEDRDVVLIPPQRNDFTKNIEVALEVANILIEKYPNVTFLFAGLQETRTTVKGYKELSERTFRKAKEIRETNPNGNLGLVVIPTGIKYEDAMGVMASPAIKTMYIPADIDGLNLTAEEAMVARDENDPAALVLSKGIGASDVEAKDGKGAIVMQAATDPELAARDVETALLMDETEIKENFLWIRSRIQELDAENFNTVVAESLAQAMEYRYGVDWRETFEQPIGDYVDRIGKQFPAGKEMPDYIKGLYEGGVDQVFVRRMSRRAFYSLRHFALKTSRRVRQVPEFGSSS